MVLTPTDLRALFDQLIAGWENEIVEFKEANDNYSTSEIGKYFSALSNEANLRGVGAGWLVFGVNNKTRSVVGTHYREGKERLNSLKNEIANGTEPSITFRNVHELDHPAGRVLLFEIPAAPRGLPVSWNGYWHARAGESLTSLGIDKQDEIRVQDAQLDWSAGIVPGATLSDLDPRAVEHARAEFIARRQGRADQLDIGSWAVERFLATVGVMHDGGLTRAAVLLLGKAESAYLLSPLLAEMTWKLVGQENTGEHFGLPFIFSTTELYQRIRNIQIRLLPPGELLPREISKYDQLAVMEALHNCIAHEDYRQGARIVVTEQTDRLIFESLGAFVDGTPEDYAQGGRTPRRYRNPTLVHAMSELNMIDRLGAGIERINQSQVSRYLPLPDYDLSEAGVVKLTIYGGVVDKAYTDILLMRTDLPFEDVLVLDRVQKHRPVPRDAVVRLRRAGLLEGSGATLRVSSRIAAATGGKAAYIRTRAQDDAHYSRLIIDFLTQFGNASRKEIDELLEKYLAQALTPQQRRDKVSNLLSKMRREEEIRNVGTQQKPRWELV